MVNKLLYCLCDRCRRAFALSGSIESGSSFLSKNKKTKMHFCSYECKIKFLKDKKYWNRKVKSENENFTRLMKRSEKCL